MGVRQCGGKFYAELVDELITFAEHNFRLDQTKEDGATERDHLESAQRQIANLPNWRGKKIVLPDAPPFPIELTYLWTWFHEISRGLSSNGMGPALITWESLAAWCSLTRQPLEAWEARALVRLGYGRAVVESEAMKKKAKTQ